MSGNNKYYISVPVTKNLYVNKMSKNLTIQEKYNQLRTLWLDSTDVVESTIYLLDLKKMKDEYPDLIQLERVPFGHPDSG